MDCLGELFFVGSRRSSERDLSLQGIDEAKTADSVFAEFCTSLMPKSKISELEKLEKRVIMLSRC